jgi:hypothetical protein
MRGLDPRIHQSTFDVFGSGQVAGSGRQRRTIVDLDAVADFDPHSTFSSA